MLIYAIFGLFWRFFGLTKKRRQRFFVNSAKMCKKMVLKDRTAVAPGKM
jgi:hypothetical protein